MQKRQWRLFQYMSILACHIRYLTQGGLGIHIFITEWVIIGSTIIQVPAHYQCSRFDNLNPGDKFNWSLNWNRKVFQCWAFENLISKMMAYCSGLSLYNINVACLSRCLIFYYPGVPFMWPRSNQLRSEVTQRTGAHCSLWMIPYNLINRVPEQWPQNFSRRFCDLNFQVQVLYKQSTQMWPSVCMPMA